MGPQYQGEGTEQGPQLTPKVERQQTQVCRHEDVHMKQKMKGPTPFSHSKDRADQEMKMGPQYQYQSKVHNLPQK